MLYCELCVEFLTRVCPFLSPPRNRFLYESDDFLIFPALGSFVEGYLLICPRSHVPSLAGLERTVIPKFYSLLEETKRIVQATFGSVILFEHGMASCERKAGGCIDHAHLHILPADVELNRFLSGQFPSQRLTEFSELSRWRQRPYLLAQSRGLATVYDVPDNLASQFLRRHIASELHLEDRWDWGAYLGIAEIENTLKKLSAPFGQLAINTTYEIPK
jgi:diadenosine tetraphosphate (Ap4A) HIT family hydrolase